MRKEKYVSALTKSGSTSGYKKSQYRQDGERVFFYLSFTLLVELVEFLTGFVFRLYYFLLLFRQVLGVQKKVINHHDMSCHVSFNFLRKLAKENEILVQSFPNEK